MEKKNFLGKDSKIIISTNFLQSIIKKDTKINETNGWDNIFTLETITNVNNPRKIPFILI
jgi:hypothetical protein